MDIPVKVTMDISGSPIDLQLAPGNIQGSLDMYGWENYIWGIYRASIH